VNARGGQKAFVSVNQKQCHRKDSIFKLVYHFGIPAALNHGKKSAKSSRMVKLVLYEWLLRKHVIDSGDHQLDKLDRFPLSPCTCIECMHVCAADILVAVGPLPQPSCNVGAFKFSVDSCI
jgi:hypothetical protein